MQWVLTSAWDWYHCKLFLLIFTRKGWPHLSFTKIILLDLHLEFQHVFIHKHFVKPFRKAVLKYHKLQGTNGSPIWLVTYYTGTRIIPLVQIESLVFIMYILILIKSRFYFLPMFLNILICYYEEKKLKLLIIVCRFESFLNIFFSQPPIFENIF